MNSYSAGTLAYAYLLSFISTVAYSQKNPGIFYAGDQYEK